MRILHCFILLGFFSGCSGIEEFTTAPDDIINLTLLNIDKEALTGDIIGDGQTDIIVRAQIPVNADDDFRLVKFQTDDGLFLNTNNMEISKRANSEGIAEVFLRLPLSNKPLNINGQVGTGNNTYQSDTTVFLTIPEDIVRLTLLNSNNRQIVDNLIADGTTVYLLNAKLLVNLDNSNSIKFTSSQGKFLNSNTNTLTTNITSADSIDILYEVSQSTATTFIKSEIEVNNLSIEDQLILSLQLSLPDTILLEPEKLTMSLNEENNISAFLRKNIGKVSEQLPVNFIAYQLVGDNRTNVGRFTGAQDARTDSDGRVSVTFRTDTDDININLPIIIESSITTSDNTNASMTTVSLNIE